MDLPSLVAELLEEVVAGDVAGGAGDDDLGVAALVVPIVRGQRGRVRDVVHDRCQLGIEECLAQLAGDEGVSLRTGQTRWVTRWMPALNAFAITFADRMEATENN